MSADEKDKPITDDERAGYAERIKDLFGETMRLREEAAKYRRLYEEIMQSQIREQQSRIRRFHSGG
jgi:hypothetical protein